MTDTPAWMTVPGPVQCKKRVTRTLYWEECPICREKIDGWNQDTRDVPPKRRYEPCGCLAYGMAEDEMGETGK